MNIPHFFTICLDFIFPPSDDALRVRNMDAQDPFFLYSLQNLDGMYALSKYTHPDIRALIHEAKFFNNKKAFLHLNALVERYLADNLEKFDVIIPIPLSSARKRSRGYNQVERMLETSDSPLTIPIFKDVLIRVRNTPPQTDLPRSERLTNLEDAFSVLHGEKITGMNMLLVDDVITTGSTLKSAKDALLTHHPASVTCVALAH